MNVHFSPAEAMPRSGNANDVCNNRPGHPDLGTHFLPSKVGQDKPRLVFLRQFLKARNGDLNYGGHL